MDNDGVFHLIKLCIYKADMTYYSRDGTYFIVDCKSSRTLRDPVYSIKAKMVKNEIGTPIKVFLKGQPLEL